MALHSTRDAVAAYVTKDGSEIRELLHPGRDAVRNQSLAEAVVPPGTTTLLHRHLRSEEIYHVTRGNGLMTLGDSQFAIAAGDSIVILPGTPHCVANTGDAALHILCCCAPAYAHDDTELL
ncbi:MAG: cupin domain-containing protein [Dechloromonas sp.]|nr:MAG: cupin domain-containing protein [Dechloromonas sp.]